MELKPRNGGWNLSTILAGITRFWFISRIISFTCGVGVRVWADGWEGVVRRMFDTCVRTDLVHGHRVVVPCSCQSFFEPMLSLDNAAHTNPEWWTTSDKLCFLEGIGWTRAQRRRRVWWPPRPPTATVSALALTDEVVSVLTHHSTK